MERQHDTDAVFWERLVEMPVWEAELECVARREWFAAKAADMARSLARLPKGHDDRERIGVEVAENNAALTKLNEHIGRLRRFQTLVDFKGVARDLCPPDLYEALCVEYEIRCGHKAQQRTEWNTK